MDRRSTWDGRSRCRRSFVLERDGERLIAHGTSRLSVFPPHDPIRPSHRTKPPILEPRDYGSPDPFERPAPEATIPQEVWSELPGAEILRRQLAGELPAPPLHHLTGLRLTEVGEGRAALRFPRPSGWRAPPAASREA